MREHERDRIAAALNMLRPDWPIRQLRTLLDSPQLADRPRRDACVALTWVACEAATANPYRVLEAGPWWRAAAIEGGGAPRNQIPAHERCSTCSKARPDCERVRFADDDHDFTPATTDNKRSEEAMHAIVQEAKGRLEPVRDPAPPREHTPDDRVTAARAELHPDADVAADTTEAADGGGDEDQ